MQQHFVTAAYLVGFTPKTSQIDKVWEQQWDLAWRNYVHESFTNRSSATATRQRRLALDLSRRNDPVPLSKVPEISARLAAAYAKKTPKTIARDVNRLIEMDLVKKGGTGIVANKEIILGFLPPQKKREAA